jgi:hypothetical protein
MTNTGADILQFLRHEAELQAAVSENVRRLVAAGRRAGLSGAELARASGLSKGAIAEITTGPNGGFAPGQELESAEVKVLLASVKNVVIVAAGRVAYREYRAYDAYICQAGRYFRDETELFGFYADGEVKPHFAKKLDVADNVVFTTAAAEALRADGHDLIARIVERVVAEGARNETDPHKVFALSASGNRQETLTLDAPIRHISTGPGTGFVQKQRYVSEQALRHQPPPQTTRDLLELDQRL